MSEVPASDVYIGDNVTVSVYTQSSMEAVLHLSDPRYDAAAPSIYPAREREAGERGLPPIGRVIDANRPEEPNHLATLLACRGDPRARDTHSSLLLVVSRLYAICGLVDVEVSAHVVDALHRHSVTGRSSAPQRAAEVVCDGLPEGGCRTSSAL